jgi:hypothetical protein
MSRPDAQWHESNQALLAAWVVVLREVLRRHARRARGEDDDPTAELDARARAAAAADAMPTPSAIDVLCSSFGLTEFERDVILLCAAPELSGDFSSEFAVAHGDAQRTYATFGLALSALPKAHWSAMAARAPLRKWRMVELAGGESLTSSALRIDERILHFLAGVPDSDARLAGIVTVVSGHAPLPASYEEVSRRIVDIWSATAPGSSWPVVEVSNNDPSETRDVVAHACEMAGLSLCRARGSDIPTAPAERDAFTVLWERESALSHSALLVDLHDEGPEALRAMAACIDDMSCPIVVATREPVAIRTRPVVRVHVEPPDAVERGEWWRSALGPLAVELNGSVDTVVSQFRLGAQDVRAAGADVVGRVASLETDESRSEKLAEALWDACRAQARQRLDDLAERVVPAAGWADLVLADTQRRVLREIAVHVRHRANVYEAWGFARKSTRGLGISALFSGPSGTGKTMAAEVLANDLQLDLFRIDLSQVVSKYIGETEKNLKRVFDAAEGGGSILLFDEADALFGKRSEVKDSHDRYANIEVSYLLQRMEAYRGLAILTTNMKAALDQAFLRRIRFLVQFTFPETPQRAEIWRGVFPEATPTDDLDWEILSRLNVAGGNIRNIAMNAAFLAAADKSPVTMGHVMRATRGEYAKLERPLTDAETRGWR